MPITKFTQPDETTPFGQSLVEIVKFLKIALPSFTGTLMTTGPGEKCWKVQVHIPGRTFGRKIKQINFSVKAPNWSVGRSHAAMMTLGRIRQEYHADLQGTRFKMYGRRDHTGELVCTVEDTSMASHIQDLGEHVQRVEEEMLHCMDVIEGLEEEAKRVRDKYEEQIDALQERNEELKLMLEEAEEQLDQGENLQEDDSDGCLVSQDEDYHSEEEENGNAVLMIDSSSDSN